MKRGTKPASKGSPIYERIRQILESARASVARSVNTTQVVANWLIGREIVEEEQKGYPKAEYGKKLVEELAVRLQTDFGKGYSAINLWLFRRFYQEYPGLAVPEILYAPRKEFKGHPAQQNPNSGHGKSGSGISNALPRISGPQEKSDAPRRKSDIASIPGEQAIRPVACDELVLTVILPEILCAPRKESQEPTHKQRLPSARASSGCGISNGLRGNFESQEKSESAHWNSEVIALPRDKPIRHAVRGESGRELPHALTAAFGDASRIGYAPHSQSCVPGQFSRSLFGKEAEP